VSPLLACKESGLVVALLATAVVVSQTTFVCVAAVKMVTSTVETTVDRSISATTTVARCVAIRVMVWRIVDVTVTGSLGLSTRRPWDHVDSLHLTYTDERHLP
jgi:hypothetical protein